MTSVHCVGSLDTWLPGSHVASSLDARLDPRQDSPFASIALATGKYSSTEPVPIPQSAYQRATTCAPLECGPRDTSQRPGDYSDTAGNVAGIPFALKAGKGEKERTVRCGKQRPMGNAASLPVPATHGPVSLASLCTALSSPASHATLAAAHAQQAAAKAPAATAAEAAATAAVAAAFARSLAYDIKAFPQPCAASAEQVSTAKQQPAGGFQVAMAIAMPHLAPPPETPVHGSSRGTSAAIRSGACNAEIRLSSKRGLYEGTVRSGSPRNTWQYCG